MPFELERGRFGRVYVRAEPGRALWSVLMASPMFLPTAAGLCLVGAAFGVYLGNASIDEINPAYLESEERSSRFYADLTPQGYRDWASVHKAEYKAVERGTDLGAGCVGCRTYPEEGFYLVHRASLGKSEMEWAEVADEPAVQPLAETREPDPAIEQIERYASFPVTADEERELAMAEPAEATVIEEPGSY